jgi:hypothetical protein
MMSQQSTLGNIQALANENKQQNTTTETHHKMDKQSKHLAGRTETRADSGVDSVSTPILHTRVE